MSVKNTSDGSFQLDVLASSKPVLVDFWAPWCGPCKMLTPVLEDLANELGDKLSIFKLNVDENPETATTQQVRSIPTLMIFQNGAPIATTVGAHPKSKLLDWINENI